MPGGYPGHLDLRASCRQGTGQVIERRGSPGIVVSDNGTELTSNAIPTFAAERDIEWHYIAQGKPMQNGFVESFNGRMRNKLLNETMFRDMAHARATMGLDHRLQRRKASFGPRLPDAQCVRRGPTHRN